MADPSTIAMQYRITMRSVIALVDDADPDTIVPACPEWSVHDVIAHLTGLASDVVSANVTGYAGPEWTDAQVATRAGDTIATMVDEWEATEPAMRALIEDLDASPLPETIDHVIGPVPRSSFQTAFLVDLVHHEHDLRGALGHRATAASVADRIAAKAHLTNVRGMFALASLPTLAIHVTDADETWRVGHADPVAELRASTLELLRTFGGRRTLEELQAMDWSGRHDAMPDHLVLPFFDRPSAPVLGG
ncbi:MAG: maleylpyruvate isomerase family mycothiol-dependent enzyme [Acidimicrobiales bacterium]